MRTRLLMLLTTLASLICFMGCRDADPGGDTWVLYRDIVTFEGNSPSGVVEFTFSPSAHAPLAHLGVKGRIDTAKVAPGTRLLLTYSLPEGVKYGGDCFNITLRGLDILAPSQVKIIDSPAECNIEPIYVSTISQSGRHINLQTLMPESKDLSYTLYIIRGTMDADTVTAILSTDNTCEPSFRSTQYASFPLDSAWRNPGVKAVKVMLNNSNNPRFDQFVFTRPPY